MNPNHYFLPNPNGRSPRSFRPNPSISANFRRQSKVFKLYQAPSTLINHPPFLSGSTDFKELCGQVQGGRPFQLYIVGQLFNLVLTFAVVWLLLSGWLFPIPQLAT